MNTSWFLTNLIAAALLPPLNLVILCMAGALMRRRWPRLGGFFVFMSLFTLLLLSTSAGAKWLAGTLESQISPLPDHGLRSAQAIVILGGGRMKNAPEYGGQETVNLHSLARLRYGARLHRESGLPILVTGGKPDGGHEPEAALMAKALRKEFAVPVQWIEFSSSHTAENAQYSVRLLKPAGIQRIVLVTDALHMPRALSIFTQYGFNVIPAPTGFLSTSPGSPADFIPRASALAQSHYALHEWIGLAWYRLRY
jgi:uncharacterized SAM-binding protein YcdF (DUF218 family)